MKFFTIFFTLLNVFYVAFVQSMPMARYAASRAARARPIKKSGPKLKQFPSTMGKSSAAAQATPTTSVQKRTLYTPAKLKGLYDPLVEKTKPFSPVFGAAKFESGLLEELYSTKNANLPEVKLVQELFHKQGAQFRPTHLKSNAAYSLTPNILGLVLGALGTDQLKDKATYNNIVEQWREESAILTGDRKITVSKVQNLMNLIIEVYKQDPVECRSTLLGFLYAKADPGSDHDMMHYFLSLNQYMPLFEETTIQKIQKKEAPALTNQNLITNVWGVIKNYLSSYFMNKADYASNEYIKLTRFLDVEKAYRPRVTGLTVNRQFEAIVSNLINAKQSEYSFPPKVVLGSYGYGKQEARPDCFETATRDFLNIILYDAKNGSFDFELLPQTAHVNNTLNDFYKTYMRIDQVNSSQAGQAFMDLVSNLPKIQYRQKNYEIKSYADNFRVLLNHLLGIKAQTIEDIGPSLSTDARTIRTSLSTEHIKQKVAIDIIDTSEHKTRTIHLFFDGGHTEMEVLGRLVNNISDQLLDEDALHTAKVTLKPEAQALLSLQRTIKTESSATPPILLDYNKTFSSNDEKEAYLEALLKSDHSDAAIQYTNLMFGTLDEDLQLKLFKYMANAGITKKNQEARYMYKRIPLTNYATRETLFDIIVDNYDETDQPSYNYAYQISHMPAPLGLRDELYHNHILEKIITSELWKRDKRFEEYLVKSTLKSIVAKAFYTGKMSVNFVQSLYEKLSPEKQQRFLFEIINFFRYIAYDNPDSPNRVYETYLSIPNAMADIIKAVLSSGPPNLTITDDDHHDTIFHILQDLATNKYVQPVYREEIKKIQKLLRDAPNSLVDRFL